MWSVARSAHPTQKTKRQELSVAVCPAALQWQIEPLPALVTQLASDRFSLFECFSARSHSSAHRTTTHQRTSIAFLHRCPKHVGALLLLRTYAPIPVDEALQLSPQQVPTSISAIWPTEADGSLMVYARCSNTSRRRSAAISTSARALAGRTFSARDVHPATLDDSEPLATAQLVFTSHLFVHYLERLHLDAFGDALAAVLLLRFYDTRTAIKDYSAYKAMIKSSRATDYLTADNAKSSVRARAGHVWCSLCVRVRSRDLLLLLDLTAGLRDRIGVSFWTRLKQIAIIRSHLVRALDNKVSRLHPSYVLCLVLWTNSIAS